MNAPIKPQLPAHVRANFATMDRADRAIFSSQPSAFAEAVASLIGILTTPKTPAELAAEARYEEQRLAWNAYVNRLRQARQARQNAVEVTKIRNAACTRCFATHAGEC